MLTVILTILVPVLGYLVWSAYFGCCVSRAELRKTDKKDAVIITGCDSGIGLAISKHLLAKLNIKLVCCFYNCGLSEGYKELAKLADQPDTKGRLFLEQLDITSSKQVENLVNRLEQLQQDGSIRKYFCLINNAGTLAYGEFDWYTWPQIESQVQVNLLGTIRLIHALLPKLIQSQGTLINVSSVCDSFLAPGISVYAATKSAVSAFTNGLHYELRKFNVNTVKVRLGDFAKMTSIMAQRESNSQAMWSNMSKRKQQYYGEYFKKFNKLADQNAGATGPDSYEDSTLFADFERLVMAKKPPTSLVIAPKKFKPIYFILGLLPVEWNCRLLDYGLGADLRPPKWTNEETD